MEHAATRASASDSLPSPSRVMASPRRPQRGPWGSPLGLAERTGAGGGPDRQPCASARALLPGSLQGFAGVHVDDGHAVALDPEGDGDGLLLFRGGPIRAQLLVGVAEMTDDEHGQAVLEA